MSFFYTDVFYNTTYFLKLIPQEPPAKVTMKTVRELDRFEKFVYFPTVFEEMRPSQMARFRRQFVWRFLWWVKNPSKRESLLKGNKEDQQIVTSRWVDIMSCAAVGIFGGILLNSLISKMQIPALDLFLEDRGFTSSAIVRRGSIFLLSAWIIKGSVQQILDSIYLWDLSLKYKEDFAKGELVSPNCEKEITNS